MLTTDQFRPFKFLYFSCKAKTAENDAAKKKKKIR